MKGNRGGMFTEELLTGAGANGESVWEPSNPVKGSGRGGMEQTKPLLPFGIQKSESIPREKMDCRSPKPPPDRTKGQLPLFGVELKIVDPELLRSTNLTCIVTVTDCFNSQDIYNGKLPIPPTLPTPGESIFLQLTPRKFIAPFLHHGVDFTVALINNDDKESSAMLVAHGCHPDCKYSRDGPCGTFPIVIGKGCRSGLFHWFWGGANDSVEIELDYQDVAFSVDLLEYLGGISRRRLGIDEKADVLAVSPTFGKWPCIPSTYGCSLVLHYGVFMDAVVAKVRVVLDNTECHDICSCGCGLIITADCGDIYKGILLFQKEKGKCSRKIMDMDMDATSPLVLKLSRSLVTMPAPTPTTTTQTLKVVLAHNNRRYSASLKAIRSVSADSFFLSYRGKKLMSRFKKLLPEPDQLPCTSDLISPGKIWRQGEEGTQLLKQANA